MVEHRNALSVPANGGEWNSVGSDSFDSHSGCTPRRRPGEAFNPWRQACGFYPPDVIRSLKVCSAADPAGGDVRLTAAAKLVYERLVRFAGRDGACFPSQERLGFELGITERQIRRLLTVLEAAGLIRWQTGGRTRGGRPKAARYEFLWHPVFDRSVSPVSTPAEPPSTGPAPSFGPDIPAVWTGHPCPPNSVHENPVHPESSSSKQNGGDYKQRCSKRTGAPIDDGDRWTFNRKPSNSPAAIADPARAWWTREELDQARRRLAELITAKRTPYDRMTLGDRLPEDAEITARILGGLQSFEDFENYIGDVWRRPECKPQGPAYLAGKLLEQWNAGRRADLQAIRDQEAAAEDARQRAEEATEAIRRAEEADGQRREAEARLKACEAMTGPEIQAEIERIRTSVEDWHDEARAEAEVSTLKALPQYRAWLADPAEKARRRREEILKELEWQRVEAAKGGAIGRWATERVAKLTDALTTQAQRDMTLNECKSLDTGNFGL